MNFAPMVNCLDNGGGAAAVEILGATFSYGGRPLLVGLHERIAQGEHVAVTGASGSGKSTLLESFVGLTRPDTGRIKVLGRNVDAEHVGWIRTQVAWMPQHVEYPYATVKEMLQAPYRWKVNRRLRPDWEAMGEAANALGLPPSILSAKLSQLSGGERQRLEIIATLSLGRCLVLMDEPTSALDPASIDLLIKYLQGFRSSTVVAVSHNQHFAQRMDRIINITKF